MEKISIQGYVWQAVGHTKSQKELIFFEVFAGTEFYAVKLCEEKLKKFLYLNENWRLSLAKKGEKPTFYRWKNQRLNKTED